MKATWTNDVISAPKPGQKGSKVNKNEVALDEDSDEDEDEEDTAKVEESDDDENDDENDENDSEEDMDSAGMYACIEGLVQERHNSIANALELHLSCTNPSIRFIW